MAENTALNASAASTRAPSPLPSITSVLGKRSSPPPPTPPLPLVGSPIPHAPQDWCAWMEWKCAVYSDCNLGRPVPAGVTPLDLREAASAACLTPVLSPPSLRFPPLPFPPLPPFCRRPLMGRRGSFINCRPRRPTPTFVSPCPAQGGVGTCPVFTDHSRSDIPPY